MTISFRSGTPLRSHSRWSRAVLAVVATALVGSGQWIVAPGAAVAAPEARPLQWLAAGDSYSAGEGTVQSGLINEMPEGETCARTPLTYGPQAAQILVSQRSWNVPAPKLVACTGATSDEFFRRGVSTHDAQFEQAGSGDRTYDVVSMSFGGNDVGFADILMQCLAPNWRVDVSWTKVASGAIRGQRIAGTPGAVAGGVGNGVRVQDATPGMKCDESENLAALKARVDEYVAGTTYAKGARDKPLPYGRDERSRTPLAGFYDQVARETLAPGGAMYVVGYPRLFADPADWGSWRGGTCEQITRADVRRLNEAGDYLNQQIRAAVDDANDRLGDDVVHFLDRAAVFAGHELCARSAVEWSNGITLAPRWMHSFHPNEIGYAKTAEYLAGAVENDLGDRFSPGAAPAPTRRATVPPVAAAPTTSQPPSPPSTVPAPIDSGRQDFDIGSPFESSCVVAWPTAPTYTSNSIRMTMDCRETPNQFLLTQVTYGDPDLPITPSTGSVVVRGTVVDIAESAYGPRFLVVQADEVELP